VLHDVVDNIGAAALNNMQITGGGGLSCEMHDLEVTSALNDLQITAG
jgi:hypothetical protein